MNFFKRLVNRAKAQKLPVSRRKNEPDVYNVDTDDERMNIAMEKARLTLHYFKASLLAPLPNQQSFSLKATIQDREQVEHIWLTDVSFDDTDNFFGKIGNEPLCIKNVKLDDEVGIPLSNVSDWMIVEDGRLIGGYTIRAIRDTMTNKERESFDASMGIYIDEGVDHFQHDLSTPEGAILCLEDAYDARDIEQCFACMDFYEEAKRLLARSTNMAFLDDEEVLKQTAEALRLSFIHSMQKGFPDFSNMSRAFPKREFINENLVLITEVCFHPTLGKSTQRLHVSRKGKEWKVLGLAE